MSERENVSLSGNYSKVGGDNNGLPGNALFLQNEFVQAVASYDRRITQRLRLVGSINYRQLLAGNAGRPKDFGGQLGVSYRLGDVR